MKKLLVVFNTCGLNKNENVGHYIRALNSLLNQTLDSYDILVSACCAAPPTKQVLEFNCKDKVYFNWIDDVLPVNVTFNHSVLEYVKRVGKAEGYLYIDSGVDFVDRPNGLKTLYEVFKQNNFGMLSARTDTDTGIDLWFNKNNDADLFTDSCLIIPIGKAVNLHVQIWHNDLLDFYGKLFPDIFASYCSESIFSFVCAAVHKQWGVYRDLIVPHIPMMDGQSAGFSPREWAASGRRLIDHPFLVKSIVDIMNGGAQYGLGYEECQNVLMHDKSKFDENGFAIDDNLKTYIKDNLFLPTHLLDYEKIRATWV